MKIGFTATQKGMTPIQRQGLEYLLTLLRPSQFHYGMCIGGDDEAFEIVRKTLPGCIIVGHPPINQTKMVYRECDFFAEPAPYLTRNKNIVKLTDRLIAAPLQEYEVLRSGTWSTIRYAKKLERLVYFLHPTEYYKDYASR